MHYILIYKKVAIFCFLGMYINTSYLMNSINILMINPQIRSI